ncbi:uncharacterized protein LOC121855990 [Homarus americanus]|uniref:uncharacterized protein LOC121855990 n=1 Tax=Homarus americanus TaxID=6706 RepID=UPI001C45BA4D|nr:uncharacterized protein LOC121855990 [Homarus americanus]XP_042207149.1 uncharacterized protein LOC121855990 [Homarus americanus]
MNPASLRHACGWRIARTLLTTVRQLSITKQHDRNRLVGILAWFREQYDGIVFSKVMQNHLYKGLISGMRSLYNPPVHFTTILVLCPNVIIDQIPVVSDLTECSPPLHINLEECQVILEVFAELQKKWTSMKNLQKDVNKEESYVLPTKSLVLEGVYFQDPEFLPLLFREIPNLCHIELQYNATPRVLKALSRHCHHLESLCLLGPKMEVLVENDIYSILFGIPPNSYNSFTSCILQKFSDEKEFREQFVLQFPNLSKLDLDELYFEKIVLLDVYTLALLLQPKLLSFGRHTGGLTKSVISNYIELWKIANEIPVSYISIYLKKAKFVDSVRGVPEDPEMELQYMEEILPMFKSLESVELQKMHWKQNHVAKFCRMFADRINAISLSDVPVKDIFCLGNISHLQVTYRGPYYFETINIILDNLPNLLTLSIHSLLREYLQDNNEIGIEQGNAWDELQHIPEDHVFDEIENEELEGFLGQINEQLNANVEANPVNLPRLRAPALYRPDKPVRRHKKPKYKVHHKLATLRIASLCEAAKDPSEVFLKRLLKQLPNLQRLCLGTWLGALSRRMECLTCTGNALVNVITDQTRNEPLLTHLKQLCCLPTGTVQEMCHSLACLAEALPSLHTLVIPVLDTAVLFPIQRYFQHSSIEVQHKCATDSVFSYWEPDH